MRFGLGRVDLWLALVVLAWSLSIIASKVVLEADWPPLGYAALRFFFAGLLLLPLVGRAASSGAGIGATVRSIVAERWARLLLAIGVASLFFNQLGFAYSLNLGSASTVALVFGSAPVLTALVSIATGTERLRADFVIAASASVAGVAVITLSQRHGGSSTGVAAVLLALVMTLGFATSSVSAMPLVRRYSALTVSALTFAGTGALLLLVSIPQLASFAFASAPEIWLCFLFTILTLVVANVLFLRAANAVGPAHASLYTNLQPFLAALLAVFLLSETLSGLELLGGALVLAGVAVAWRSRAAAPPPLEP